MPRVKESYKNIIVRYLIGSLKSFSQSDINIRQKLFIKARPG